MDTVPVNVAASPLAAPITAQLAASLVYNKDVNFHFRKDKELEKTNPSTKDKTKRPTFKMPIPLLTKAGLIAALSADDKATELALEQANEAIINRARGLINDKVENDKFNVETGKYETVLTSDMFNVDSLSFLAIALLPKSERGSGISKEQWAGFVTDYKETMQSEKAIQLFPDKKARTTDVLDKHAAILGGKFNAVRSRKDVVGQMLGFLDIWLQASPNAEDFEDCYNHLRSKGELLMQGEEFTDL